MVLRFALRALPTFVRRATAFIRKPRVGLGTIPAKTVARKASDFARTVFSRAIANPMAGRTIPQALKKFGGSTLGFGLAVEAFQFQRSRVTGDKFNPFLNVGSVVAFAVNPIASFAGSLFGGGQKAIRAIENIPIPKVPHFDVPMPFDAGGDIADALNALGAGVAQFGSGFSSSIGVPSASFGSSFTPSVNIGGGTDLTPLILALLAGGAIGAGIGRRRKRKKKKKKSKRHKKRRRQRN